ncbi:MAG: N-acetylmuramoyl-L-alanine amidase [Lachnospiraceae bacterium]|nr:N-acetylmuramoyl-L-alanine amidase [Lachnospiraceae bacterium]
MAYTNSSLATHKKISPNKTSPRNHKIDTITIHCMAGNLSVESCGNVFAGKSKKASSNYGIGSDGRIAMYVEEKDRSWASSNASNDHRAVTIEVANDGGAPDWHISDKAMSSLIELTTDICKRNKIRKLVWSANKNDRIRHLNGCNMTVHRDFAAKACPGNYLYHKHSYIAAQVNKKLNAVPSPVPVSHKFLFEGLDYSPVFDPTYYADKYQDLKKAFGTNSAALFSHFCSNGMNEGRVASVNFNVAIYQNGYADLRNAFGNNLPLYYKHYITNGHAEKRKCV